MEEIEFVAIQLSRVKERVENVNALEKQIGAPIRRMEAVDVLSDRWARFPYCSSYASRHGGRSLKATEIACFASHLEALRRAATSGAGATVIFEDDAALRPGVDASYIWSCIAALPPDAEFVTTVRHDNGRTEPEGESLGWARRYRRLPYGTSSLVLFPGTYRRLESHLLPISMPIDVQYNRAVLEGHLTAYGPADPGNWWTCNGDFKSQLHIER